MITVAEMSQWFRKAFNETQSQMLAEATGRSVGFVSQIERGLSHPTVLDLNVIADRLGVPGSYFYALPNAPERTWITRPNQRRTLRYADCLSSNAGTR